MLKQQGCARIVVKLCIMMMLFFSISTLAHSRLLRVAVVTDPAMRHMEQLSIQSWDRLAKRLNYRYQLYPVPNVNSALILIQKHKVDIAVGLPPPDDTWPGVMFINSYLDNDIGIVLPEKISIWKYLLPYFKVIFGTAIGILLLLTTFIGTLVWLAERKGNAKQFPIDPWYGIANGFWYALATMTGVGYGDVTPKSLLGRVVGTIWLIVVFIAASSFTVVVTAELASARIAQGQINSLTQLHGQKIAFSQFNEQIKLLVTQFFGVPRPMSSIDAAVTAVNQGTVAAAFVNLIELRCHALDNPGLEFNLSTSRISLGYYAMAVPQGSDLTGKINQALYFMNQQGILKNLEKNCG